jgi:hypothetical protein
MKRLLLMLAGLLALGIVMEGCRRQPLNERAVHETLAEKQEQRRLDIERGVQAAPPPIEVPPSQPAASDQQQGQAATQGGVPSYTPPPPLTTNSPSSGSSAPTAPADTRTGDVQLDPTTGQYGIAPPGAPPGYTIPLDNSRNGAK